MGETGNARSARATAGPPARLLGWVCGGLAWLALCAPALAPSLQLGDRDTGRLYYPIKQTIAEGLAHGELRLWDPWVEAGTSLLGQVTPGLLHPFTLLYVALPFGLAFKLNHLLALLLGGVGAALLARALGASVWAALAGGIAFGGSGALVSAASSNLPFALGPAALPLGLAGLLWYARSAPAPGRLLLASAAAALPAYGGDPQSLGIGLLLGALLLPLLADAPLPRAGWAERRKAMLRALGLAARWAGCALLLAAPVALPGAAQLSRSARGQALTEIEEAAWAAPPARLLGLLIPAAFDAAEPERGETSDTYAELLAGPSLVPFFEAITLGAPALLLAGFAAAAGRGGRFLLGTALLLVLASTGAVLRVQPALALLIPGWRLFRYAEKLLLPASCLLAVAAALGAERALCGSTASARRLLQVSLALAALLGAAALLLWLDPAPIARALANLGRTHDEALALRFEQTLRSGLGQATALSTALGLVAAWRLRRPGFPQLAAAGAAGLCFAAALTGPGPRTVPASLFEGRSTAGARIAELGGESAGRYRAWSDANRSLLVPSELTPAAGRLFGARETLWPQLQSLDHIEGVAPYFSAPDRRFVAALTSAHAAIFSLLGVRFWVLPPGSTAPAEARTPLAQSEAGFRIAELPAQPRAFLAFRSTPLAREEDALLRLASPGFDPRREVLLPAGGPSLQDGEGGEVAILERPRPERYEITVETPAPALLVIAEHFDPGWAAAVDGRAAEVLEADLVALAVALPPGRHRIALRFRPPGLIAGLACAALTTLVLGALWAFRRGTR